MGNRLRETAAHWVVPAAFLAHCAEELPRFPAWATEHFGTTTTRFYLASHAVLVPWVLSNGAKAMRRPDDRRAVFASAMTASALGLNGVFHLVTTRLFREYSPGVVTGATLMLPASVFALARIRRSGVLTDEDLVGAFLAGTALSTAAVGRLYVDMPRLGG